MSQDLVAAPGERQTDERRQTEQETATAASPEGEGEVSHCPSYSSQGLSRPLLLSLELRRQSQQLLRPLLMAGKLAGWGVVGAIHPGKLVNITDSNNGTSFLVDTGSSYSIIQHTSQQTQTGPLLRSANGQ